MRVSDVFNIIINVISSAKNKPAIHYT